MKNTETTMRDIMQLAIVILRFAGNTKALYNIAFQLTNGKDIYFLDLDSDKDIIDVLEITLKENNFMPLDINTIKLSSISVVSFNLNSKVK